jgi:hypothetical protein
MQEAAGGTTGLLVRTVKSVGKGNDAELIDLYEVDTGLLREIREFSKQAAQELGQWTDHASIEHEVKSYEVGNTPDDLCPQSPPSPPQNDTTKPTEPL